MEILDKSDQLHSNEYIIKQYEIDKIRKSSQYKELDFSREKLLELSEGVTDIQKELEENEENLQEFDQKIKLLCSKEEKLKLNLEMQNQYETQETENVLHFLLIYLAC